VNLRGEGLCAAKSIYQICGLPRLGISRCGKFGRARTFLRRAQYVVKFKIYSAVNSMRFKVLTRRGICGIFGIYQIKF